MTRGRRLQSIGTLAGLFLLAACGDAPPDADNATVTDSAGVRLVYNHEPAWAPGEGWTVAAEPALVLDGAEPAGGFGQVLGARRLSDGTIAVLDALQGGAVLYDAAGAYVGTAGAPGRGPGRFEFPARAFVLPGDTLAVEDYPSGDVSFFAPRGELLRHAPLDRESSFGGILRDHLLEQARTLPDGSRIMEVRSAGRSSAAPGEGHRPTLGYIRVAPGRAAVDTLGWLPTTLQASVERDGRLRPVTSLLSPHAELASAGDRVAVGESGAWDIAVFEDGDLLHRIRMTDSRRSVTDADLDSVRALEVAAMEAGRMPPERIAEWQEMWDAAPRDEYWPTFGSLFLDPAGRVWASGGGRPGEDLPVWRVFDEWGVYLGQVRMPADLDVLDIGEDFVLGTTPAPSGNRQVQLHHIIRP